MHRYEHNLVPVSKVPAGIKFGVHDGENFVEQTATPSTVDATSDPNDVFSEIGRAHV